MNDDGNYELSKWFGCSRAAFAVLPRVLMEAMSDEWQYRMAVLLSQYSDTFDTTDLGIQALYVSAKGDNNKFTKMPEWVLNYRHPDKSVIRGITLETSISDYRYEYFNMDKINREMENYNYNISKLAKD